VTTSPDHSVGASYESREPRLHSHVADALPADHPLASKRVHCDRCETLLHLQSNSCMRTWLETGRGNFCLRCFIRVAGGLVSDDTRLAGADCLPRSFALPSRGVAESRGAQKLSFYPRRRERDAGPL
jgi:hypothetical protein